MTAEHFEWMRVHTVDEMQAFYESCLPKIRDAARWCGYAIGAHGSMRRDMDLIAVPWAEEDVASPDELAKAIQTAACGISNTAYQWEQKPRGRIATSFPICWIEWYGMVGAGHVDLSVMGAP